MENAISIKNSSYNFYFYLLIYFNIKEFLTILINTSKSKMDNSNE